jgi:hypothetical protein
MLLFIQKWVEFPMRRAHQVKEEGAPHGRARAAKCGMRAATSPTSNKCQIKGLELQGRATSQGCGLPPQGCATSPRGAHFPNNTCSNQIAISSINPQSILGLSPLTISLTFVLLFQLKHVPTCSFIFALADFY